MDWLDKFIYYTRLFLLLAAFVACSLAVAVMS